MLARFNPLILLGAGLIGAAGVALAAAATHLGAALLGPASAMCLAHAPALLALYLAATRFRTATPAGLMMALGTALFAGDLVMKHFYGGSLFPLAAPTGGLLMIAAWLVAGAGALMPQRG